VTPAEGRPYLNPYLAGVGIGTVLLSAYVVMGQGIGASGAFSSVVASGVAAASPAHAAANPSYAAYVPTGPLSLFHDWLVWEIAGVIVGGALSAWQAGRFRVATERGPRLTARGRWGWGFAGGVLMAIGAKLARGCTSGQALSGGAMLSVGSWLFILGAFAAGYMVAPIFRRLWT
jgi:uncharacterized membrane protein YedE/YeeE